MPPKRIHFFLLFLFHLPFYGQSEDNDFICDYITTEEGLSHNYASTIISDDLNNKWIGTENGITKYNGYDYEKIKPSLGYSEIRNENVEILFKDHSNNIWIGTKSGGLSYFDVRHNTVKNYNAIIDEANEGDLRITAISQDSQDRLWVGTWDSGVFVVDIEKNKLVKHFKLSGTIFSIIQGKQGNMWFSNFRSVYQLDVNLKLIKQHKFKHIVSDLCFDKYRQRVWIVLSGQAKQLYYFDYTTKNIATIATNFPSNYKNTLAIDDEKRLWVGTWGGGIYRANADLSSFDKIKILPETSERTSRNFDVILSIHIDRNKQIWLGTANAGVVKLIPNKGFENASALIPEDSFNGDFNITSIYKTQDRIFLGTLKGGLYTGENIKNLKSVSGLENTKIFSLYRYKEKLLIGAQKGFFIYDLNTKSIDFTNETYKKITRFYIDQEENLFIGTQQQGIIIVPLSEIENSKSYKQYSDNQNPETKIESDRITGIEEDSQGNIWVSTYNGIHLYDKKSQKFTSQKLLLDEELPSVITNSLVIKGDKIWMGTPGGLFCLGYDRTTKKLKILNRLTVSNGLNNDFISSILFDGKDNIWFSTTTEIIKYNPEYQTFIAYGRTEGINTQSFNNRSAFNYNDQLFYFGGIDNFTFFDPEHIVKNYTVPEVVLSNLRINNKEIDYRSDNSNIDQTIGYATQITLDPDDKFFEIGFAVNDYLGENNVKYRYRLLDYQENWINLQSKNEINFASLSPGKYTLQIQATRDNQTWSASKSIDIEVKKSIWLSYWAIFLYMLIISLSAYYFIKFKQNQLRLKTDLKIIKIEKEKEFALNEAKLNFFTNISHEFRTPLTLILSPLKELLNSKELSDKEKKRLNIVDQNANKLLNLINQLLDFRKAESGLLKLNASEGNFVRFSEEVYLYFKKLASDRKIKYKFKPENEEIRFPFDRNKMEIVLCNLLSNAMKYCNPGDQITFGLKQESDTCIITIKDTGIGIDEENLDKIFDRFFQIKTANSSKMVGSGIGLTFTKKIVELHHGTIEVQSKKNQGTKFILKIGMNPKFYEGEIDETFLTTDNMLAYDAQNKGLVESNLNPDLKQATILVVEDNAEILNYIQDILIEDFQVLTATNGEEGLQVASREVPDLIISDVMMPVKDGITMCKELKSQITTSHIPIILLTARTSTVFEIEGLKTGADDYVTKPFNPMVIKARITSLLENREKQRHFLANKVRFEPLVKTSEDENNLENAFIEKAMNLVESNLHNPDFGIDSMLDALNMSQSTLYRKIKSLTGLSLTGFIRSVRLKKAAQLIISTDLNLSEIAYDVGFNDYKYFKTSFKKQFKCLPSKYAKKIKQLSDQRA